MQLQGGQVWPGSIHMPLFWKCPYLLPVAFIEQHCVLSGSAVSMQSVHMQGSQAGLGSVHMHRS